MVTARRGKLDRLAAKLDPKAALLSGDARPRGRGRCPQRRFRIDRPLLIDDRAKRHCPLHPMSMMTLKVLGKSASVPRPDWGYPNGARASL
jgi:hypothetical protein